MKASESLSVSVIVRVSVSLSHTEGEHERGRERESESECECIKGVCKGGKGGTGGGFSLSKSRGSGVTDPEVSVATEEYLKSLRENGSLLITSF